MIYIHEFPNLGDPDWESVHEVLGISGRRDDFEFDQYVWALSTNCSDPSSAVYGPYDCISPMWIGIAESPQQLAAAFQWRYGEEFSERTYLWGHLGRGWMNLGYSVNSCNMSEEAWFRMLDIVLDVATSFRNERREYE